MTSPERCPVHAAPDADFMHTWPCPTDCQHFLAELERRIADVEVHGNFTRMWRDEATGLRMRQKFRNHKPVGEPRPWPDLPPDD